MHTSRLFSLTFLVLLLSALIFIPGAALHAGSLVAMAFVPLSNRPKLLGTLNFQSGGTDKLLPSNGLQFTRYKKFRFVVSMTFNKAGATVFGTLAPEAPFTIFRDVRLYGISLLQKAPLRWLRQLNHKYLRQADANFTAPTATNTNEVIQFSVDVDCTTLQCSFADGTQLDLSKKIGAPSLEVDFGTVEDLIAGGNYTTKTLTGATVTVFGLIDQQAIFNQFNFAGRQVRYIESSINNQTIAEYPTNLAIGQAINRILVGGFTKGPDVPINTLVPSTAKVRIDVNGLPVWGPFTVQEIQRENVADAKGLALDTGYFIIDFLRTPPHNQKDWLDLTDVLKTSDPGRVTECKLFVDVAPVANAFLGVVTDGTVPPYLLPQQN